MEDKAASKSLHFAVVLLVPSHVARFKGSGTNGLERVALIYTGDFLLRYRRPKMPCCMTMSLALPFADSFSFRSMSATIFQDTRFIESKHSLPPANFMQIYFLEF